MAISTRALPDCLQKLYPIHEARQELCKRPAVTVWTEQ
jgi:hypothetical protein